MEASAKKPSGLLNVQKNRENFSLVLLSPSPDLDLFVEHYWIVSWDLNGKEPIVSENLPHPSVHLVIEPGQCRVVGVIKEKFSFLLKEKGFVFGIKFRPGAFYSFVHIPVHTFTGCSIAASKVFGTDVNEWEEAVRAADNVHERIVHTEAFLRKRRPSHDETVSLIKTMVDTISADRTMKTVDELAARFHLSTRMLQRMFSKYVGISPKWVIGRYRLLEVADLLAYGQSQNWTELANQLGYYDQSHFIKDFKTIIGLSPEEYIRKNTVTDPH